MYQKRLQLSGLIIIFILDMQNKKLLYAEKASTWIKYNKSAADEGYRSSAPPRIRPLFLTVKDERINACGVLQSQPHVPFTLDSRY